MDASNLLDIVADAAVGQTGDGPIHERIASAWGTGRADLIRQTLVLCADHELNASTFAARVAASTGASLAASLTAGLAALSGPRHGGASLAFQRFAGEAARLGPAAAIAARLAEGRVIAGFGHQLYPEGDPRAQALLAQIELPPATAELRRAVETVAGKPPNVDFALAAVAEALNLPAEAPFALFAVGRCAGWIAHAVEQAQTGALIRPRARYVGPSPEPIE
jgi:citrate synthase